jgi:hypothetical protein
LKIAFIEEYFYEKKNQIMAKYIAKFENIKDIVMPGIFISKNDNKLVYTLYLNIKRII